MEVGFPKDLGGAEKVKDFVSLPNSFVELSITWGC